MGGRAQTTQDFAIGTSVMLVTIIGVFFFLQTGGLAVYEGTSDGVRQPQADRVASYLVENYSSEAGRNVLRFNQTGGINWALDNDTDELAGVVSNAGVDVSTDRRTDPILNVSIVNGSTLQAGQRIAADDNGTRLHWGEYRRADPVTSTRVVRLAGDDYDCDPVCWLVVRAW